MDLDQALLQIIFILVERLLAVVHYLRRRLLDHGQRVLVRVGELADIVR